MDLMSGKGLGETVREGTSGALKRAKDGSQLKKQFKTVDLRTKLADLKLLLAKRTPDEECRKLLDVKPATYNELKKELFRQETAALYNRTAEETFLDYQWQQTACLTELDDMIRQFNETKQYNALVGAIRTKSDIIDKIVKVGQDMGVLDKAPERKLILHGHAVANMDNVDLRKLISKELQGLSSVVSKYGDSDLMGKPVMTVDADGIEVPPEPAPGPSFTATGKPNISKGGQSKVAAGKARHQVKRVKTVDP